MKASFWAGNLGCGVHLILTEAMLLIIASCFAWMSSSTAGFLLTIAWKKYVPSDTWTLPPHRAVKGGRGKRVLCGQDAGRSRVRRRGTRGVQACCATHL